MEFIVNSFSEAYVQIREQLLQAPEIAPRGMKTKELLGVTIHLTNPRNRLGFHKDRHYPLTLMIAEAIMLFSDSDQLAHLKYINPRMEMYSDNGKTLWGSYGNRIHTHIQDVLRKLEEDKDTRQAILPIIRPYDLKAVTKDFPCTQFLQLMIRNNKLHMFTVMRSNDFGWGLQFDLPAFTIFQEIIANTLHLEIGEYWHIANSMHIYDYHYELLEKIDRLEPIEFAVPYILEHMPRLINIVERLPYLIDDSEMFEDTPFDAILRSFWRKKKNLPYQIMPYTDFSWVDQFMRYKVKNNEI